MDAGTVQEPRNRVTGCGNKVTLLYRRKGEADAWPSES